jgi:hypothetical protein
MVAVRRAMDVWVRIRANREAKSYELVVAPGDLSEPVAQQLIEIAFKDRVIDSEGHPALRRLRGEI